MGHALDDAAMPRLRSDVWVAAYMRRCAAGGAFVALSRRGDQSAGAIFIEVMHADGVDLWGPAPGGGGRVLERVLQAVAGFEVAERMAKEKAFDSDLWLVTVEDREGRDFLQDHEHV
jgi:hypothetical protein